MAKALISVALSTMHQKSGIPRHEAWGAASAAASLGVLYARATPPHPGKVRVLKAILRILRAEEIALRDSETGTVFLADSKDFVGWDMLTKGSFEPESLRLCLEIMRKRGGVFADIGAHHGLFSSTVSSLGHAKVISFEPNPASFLRLLANVRANARTNVTLVHAPLGRSGGGLLPWRHSGASAGTTAWSHGAKQGEASDYWLATTCFADALAATGVEAPALVKMDVEGAELSVLEGFDFERCRPSYFLIEAQPHWPEKFAFLVARGYHATGESGAALRGVEGDAFLEGNALFTDHRGAG
jgi:FkbM family methyltransferase